MEGGVITGFEPVGNDLMVFMVQMQAAKYARIKGHKFNFGDKVMLNEASWGLYSFYLRQNRGLPMKARQEVQELMDAAPLTVVDMEMLDDDGKSYVCYTCFSPDNRIYVIPQHFLKRYEEE